MASDEGGERGAEAPDAGAKISGPTDAGAEVPGPTVLGDTSDLAAPGRVSLVALARARELPATQLAHPFGPEWDVFTVAGKIFLLATAEPGGRDEERRIVNLKVDPADSEALRAEFAAITPGFHMNKRHWISVYPSPDIPSDLVRDLVTESYLLVVAGLPKARRPVDPATFRLA